MFLQTSSILSSASRKEKEGKATPDSIQKYSGGSDCCSFRAYPLDHENFGKVPPVSVRHLRKL